ncbi:MAG: hypothetical protein HY647_02735 [Acidobacteria bacterium]|nr:hypothetical protein [Acidobacteriota bacterium]
MRIPGGKKFWGGALLALLLIAGGVWLWLWQRQVRWDLNLLAHLPPKADLYVAADLQSLQSNVAVRRYLADSPEFSREPEYESFVQATGFRYQDHLKQLALAKFGPDWMGVARLLLDPTKVQQYTESQSGRKYSEQGRTVYVFGTARPFRLALLENDFALFTVGGDEQRMRQALQMYPEPSSPSGASELEQSDDLSHIRQSSSLWAVGRMEKLLDQGNGGQRWGTWEMGRSVLQGSKTLYISAQSTSLQLQFQIENYCNSPASAERITSFLQAVLNILRAKPSSASSENQTNLAAFLADLSVRQAEESVFIEWQWDENVWRWLRGQSQ